jgi:hypothetical protein
MIHGILLVYEVLPFKSFHFLRYETPITILSMPPWTGNAKLHLLLFADDIILLADSPQQLQQKINITSKNFKSRGLSAEVAKILCFENTKY